jgi:hypothetical protein
VPGLARTPRMAAAAMAGTVWLMGLAGPAAGLERAGGLGGPKQVRPLGSARKERI